MNKRRGILFAGILALAVVLFGGVLLANREALKVWKQAKNYEKAVLSLAGTSLEEDGSYQVTEELLYVLSGAEYTEPKSVIFMIGDGMGFNIVEAAQVMCADKLYNGTLAMNYLPVQSSQCTYSVTHQVTDSAAGATAFATGFKTANKTISMDSGWSTELKTVLELAAEKGKSTGIVATEAVTEATPAVYVAHMPARAMEGGIAAMELSKFADGSLDLALGGGSKYYEVSSNAEELAAAKAAGMTYTTEWERAVGASLPLAGLFAKDEMNTLKDENPSLAEMTDLALNLLGEDENGFFLMVEGSQIDNYEEYNLFDETIKNLYDFDCAIAVAMKYVALHPDTVLIVTADHETGGVMLPENPSRENLNDTVFTTKVHTSRAVPVYAVGYGTEALLGINENTDLGILVASYLGEEEFGARSVLHTLSDTVTTVIFDGEKEEQEILLKDSLVPIEEIKNARAFHVTVKNIGSTRSPLPKLKIILTGQEYSMDPQQDYIDVGETMTLSYIFPEVCWEDSRLVKIEKMVLTTDGQEATFEISDMQVTERSLIEVRKDVTVMDAEAFHYTFIFDRNLDNDPAHKHIASSYSGDSRDYACIATDELITYLAKVSSLEEENFVVKTDDCTAEYEILVGRVDRPEYRSFLETLDGNEYGILVKDNKIILGAWNDASLEACVDRFKEVLEQAKTTVDGVDSWILPDGFCVTGVANEKWIVDFPRPEGEGIRLYNTQNANDDSLQFLYTGSGVNGAAFTVYCEALETAGYEIVTENVIEGSMFKTFRNDQEGITLYTAYNDYKYESRYMKEDEYSVDYEKCIRVVSAPLGSVTLPDEGLLTESPLYTKVTDSSLTAVGLVKKAVGMSYVIMLEDGSFVVLDGGTGASNLSLDLWETLTAMHTEAYGEAPSAEHPIHVAAWIITHSHEDHYGTFQKFLARYGSNEMFKMDYLIGNFPEESVMSQVKMETYEMGLEKTIPKLQDMVLGGFQYVKVHTGQKFYIANLTMEILMTFEDHNPRPICNSNDTCTVIRFTIANSESVNGDGITAVFLADAFRYQSRYLCAMYGDYLKSDIVQLAHHGNIGSEKAIYETIQPTVVLFPNCRESFDIYTDPARRTKAWNYDVDQYVVYDLDSVKYIYVSDEERHTTLKFKAEGPNYDNIYDAKTGARLTYDNYTIKK